MGEIVVVRQNAAYETWFWASDPNNEESSELYAFSDIHQLTPYGMMLAGLAACTTVVMHTYAQAHGLHLHEVQVRTEYGRIFAKDCENCERQDAYDEAITMDLRVSGRLSAGERKRLLRAAHLCPIHKMLSKGIEVQIRLLEEEPQ